LEAMALEDRYQLEPVSEETPERQFERRWALTVLDQALGLLRREYTRQGKATVFECLQKYLKQNPARNVTARRRWTLNTTPGAWTWRCHRLRQRYGEMIRKEVAALWPPMPMWDEELSSSPQPAVGSFAVLKPPGNPCAWQDRLNQASVSFQIHYIDPQKDDLKNFGKPETGFTPW